MKIKKAILPVAGFGTRFLPATKAQSKEMLPIFDTPAIQFIVEELVEAGIEDIIIVTGKGKRAIEDHFDANFELEFALQEKQKHAELEMVRKISNLANFVYVRQPTPMGDGHAILCARNLVGKDESVVVCFGDDLVDNPKGKNAVEQLLEVYEDHGHPVALLERIKKEESNKYGIVDFEQIKGYTGRINHFVEKPEPHEAPSDLGIVGKYVITPDIFRHLEDAQKSPDGEIRLANAFMKYLSSGGELHGKILEGLRFDTGDKLGFLKATLHYALQKEPESVADALRDYLFKKS